MAFDLDAWLEEKRPQRIECPLARDPAVIEEHLEAKVAADVARTVFEDNPTATSRAALADAEDRLAEAATAAEAATTVFVFEGIGDQEWDALMGDHRPTKEQITKAQRDGQPKPSWNEETFPAALVSACCVEPKLTVEGADRLLKHPRLNAAETQALFIAARDASRTRRVPQLGKGSGRTLS